MFGSWLSFVLFFFLVFVFVQSESSPVLGLCISFLLKFIHLFKFNAYRIDWGRLISLLAAVNVSQL